MFFDSILCFLIVGLIMLALVIPYSIFVLFMFAIYKADGGKMKYSEYVKYW